MLHPWLFNWLEWWFLFLFFLFLLICDTSNSIETTKASALPSPATSGDSLHLQFLIRFIKTFLVPTPPFYFRDSVWYFQMLWAFPLLCNFWSFVVDKWSHIAPSRESAEHNFIPLYQAQSTALDSRDVF